MLTTKQKQFLRAKAHNLKPVVIIGAAGLTDNVVTEVEHSIEHHELIKIKINANDRNHRQQMVAKLGDAIQCECITTIGHIAVLYRPAKKSKLDIPS